MNPKFDEYLKINFEDYDVPEYFSDKDKERFRTSVIMMLEMQKLITKSVAIAKTAAIPLKLVQELVGIVENFQELANSLNNARTPNDNSNLKNNAFERIYSEHTNFFEISSSNKKMGIINAISNYETSFDIESIQKMDEINSELIDKNNRVDEILRKLEKPSAEKVLATYASEYAEEEIINNRKSRDWLRYGIVLTIVFIAVVMLSISYEWFPSKMKLENNTGTVARSYEIINVPVLVTKVMLVSMIIYFIVFCFKQYSINKHLAVVNQQRKNAFNSYVLFAASVGEKDIEAKRALLMSLAKTIHESVNTGFLSSKQSDHPLIQSVEMGKFNADMIGQ